MNFIKISKALEQKKGNVAIRGWVYRERKLKDKIFLVIRDSSDIIQCIVKSDNKEAFLDANKILIESSVEIQGEIYQDKRAPTLYEIKVEKLNVVSYAEPFPITEDQSPEFLLDKRHLWIRSRKLTWVMKVRSTVFDAIDRFFRDRGYYEMPPPVFTPNAAEGGATLFEVKYFKEKVYLTQSWQLYAEAAIFSLEKIYCISPCFRAEKSKTSRHLAEFYMAEVEEAWAGLDEMTHLAQELVSFVVSEVLRLNVKELEALGVNIEKLKKVKTPFYKKTYSEVLDMLKKDGVNIKWGKDLRTIEEDIIMKHFDKPLIVTHYPKEIMAFYKPRDKKDPKVALCFDMLAPDGFGEIIGGSQRDTDIEELKKSLKAQGERPENYEWYFDTRRYGSVPHAGFGLGVERVVAWICNLDNIKDAIPFPRTMNRKSP